MKKKIAVFSQGRIVTFDKPMTSNASKELKEMTPEEKKSNVVKYTFADCWTGFHVTATMWEMRSAQEKLEESYIYDGYAAWTDLWAESVQDYIPEMSAAGNYMELRNKKSGKEEVKSYTACFGWSREFVNQVIGEDWAKHNPLRFDNVWDEEHNLYWITTNIEPITGYDEY